MMCHLLRQHRLTRYFNVSQTVASCCSFRHVNASHWGKVSFMRYAALSCKV